MKNYERPIVTINEGLAEGVYAASGMSNVDCWIPSWKDTQAWNGWAHEFEIKVVHQMNYEHISECCITEITFSSDILATSNAQYECTVSGNKMSITRTLHGNAYSEGDTATFKVWVTTGDQATTEALTITGIATTYCGKTINVQGGGAGEL